MNKSKKLYALYDTKDNDICIGIFRSYEIVEKFHIKPNTLFHNISLGQKLESRYKIVALKEGEET